MLSGKENLGGNFGVYVASKIEAEKGSSKIETDKGSSKIEVDKGVRPFFSIEIPMRLKLSPNEWHCSNLSEACFKMSKRILGWQGWTHWDMVRLMQKRVLGPLSKRKMNYSLGRLSNWCLLDHTRNFMLTRRKTRKNVSINFGLDVLTKFSLFRIPDNFSTRTQTDRLSSSCLEFCHSSVQHMGNHFRMTKFKNKIKRNESYFKNKLTVRSN